MARHSSYPTLYDECKTVTIGFLRKYGYLTPNNFQSGIIKWTRNGDVTSSISVSVNMKICEGVFNLSYKWNGQSINYPVELVSRKSNLGVGNVFYFLCPFTGKTCRKLYLIGGRFCHREAARGCFYEKQTMSKNTREMISKYEIVFNSEKVYEERFKKYFKPTYNGKPTKKLLRLQEKLAIYEQVNGKILLKENWG